MNRRAFVCTAFTLLASAPLAAQSIPAYRRIGGGAQLIAYPEETQMLSGTPRPWRDSAFAAWAAEVADFPETTPDRLRAGARVTVELRLRRNGDLDQVRLEGSTGAPEVDSSLVAAAHRADQALRFPALPPSVEGAGREIRFLVAVPSPRVVLADTLHVQRTAVIPSGVTFPAPTPACADSLARPTGYRSTRLGLKIDSVTGGSTAGTWSELARQAVVEAWRSPGDARPDSPPSIFRGSTAGIGGTFAVLGSLRLLLDDTGRLLRAAMAPRSLYPAIDSSLVAAAWRADSAHAFPPPPGTRSDTAMVAFGVEERGMTSASLPLGGVAVAEWTPKPPALFRAGRMRYPSDLRSQRIGGRVEVEFVVGPDGVPVRGSLVVRTTPHPGFSAAVDEMIYSSRYAPGTVHSCPVPVLVRQGVNFNP